MNKERTTLDSIAGYDEEKEEAKKLIDILSNFEQYKAQGASVPKGLLLCGEPGVGKTMFARAISAEAKVPIFEFDAKESENEDETLKGLKQLFAKAKESVPSIVFIDELDELVSSIDPIGIYGFQSDYSRKALKTLLTEIDGISSSEGVLVIATTNSKRTVPAPLKRSGRLEKQVTFNLPSVEDRLAIAKLYLRRINANSIDANAIASKTEGFSGADIKSLINASLIEAVRRRTKISLPIIVSTIPTIRFGEIKKNNRTGPKDSVCYHEIGHFLAQYALTGEVGSISVENYGEIAGRVEMEEELTNPFRPKTDFRSSDEMLDSISVCLGGIAGEEVFLGKRFCGSYSDISASIEIIRTVMLNGALGFELLPSFNIDKRLGGGLATMTMSNKNTTDLQSEKIVQILNEKLMMAINFVKKWKGLGDLIYPLLKEKEVLSKEELVCLIAHYRKNDIGDTAS